MFASEYLGMKICISVSLPAFVCAYAHTSLRRIGLRQVRICARLIPGVRKGPWSSFQLSSFGEKTEAQKAK